MKRNVAAHDALQSVSPDAPASKTSWLVMRNSQRGPGTLAGDNDDQKSVVLSPLY
jgi:hypothetical protein